MVGKTEAVNSTTSSNINNTHLLGRLSTSLKIGIVGLPNVGKSTFFNVLTKNSIPAENYPFCTIDPNESRCVVTDERLDWLNDLYKPELKVNAFLNVVDIAGLIAGAHKGQGLGNAFLSNISSCDAIFHFIRAFDNDQIVHVENDVNPLRDLLTINQELILKDLSDIEKKLESLEKQTRTQKKEAIFEYKTILKAKQWLEEEKQFIRQAQWSVEEAEVLQKYLFLTSKPTIYLVNLSEKDYRRRKNKYLPQIKQWLDEHDRECLLIPFSAEFERKLEELKDNDEERRNFLQQQSINDKNKADNNNNNNVDDQNNIKLCESSLDKIIKEGFKVLNLEYFFTCGPKEVKCWIVRKHSKAPQAARRIHTDFEKNFIRVDVMHYDDLKQLGTVNALKNAGKYYTKGKDYVVQDGDILLFKTNKK